LGRQEEEISEDPRNDGSKETKENLFAPVQFAFFTVVDVM
jgi:hypothetical protein